MKILLVVFGLLVLATASYAVNVGDIIGGYPAGYSAQNPGDFRDHVGEPITPTFTPTVTVQPAAIGTMEGPFPAGYGLIPGTSAPTDAFLDDIDRETNPEEDNLATFVREGDRLNNVIRAGAATLKDNLRVMVVGSNASSVNTLGYYVGYKVISISW